MSHGPQGAARHHLAAVADAFLSLEPMPARRVDHDPPLVCVAAPGASDTSFVLACLATAGKVGKARDLGADVGRRLAGWEGGDRAWTIPAARAVLLWCPRGEEGLAIGSGLVLGRLGALLRPVSLTVLWLAGGPRPPGRQPSATHRRRAAAMARAAIPGVAVDVRCVGWLEAFGREVHELADWRLDAFDFAPPPSR